MSHYDSNSQTVKDWKLKMKQRLRVKRLAQIAERLSILSPKIDSGRHTFADVRERDRLVSEYLKLEKESQNDTN